VKPYIVAASLLAATSSFVLGQMEVVAKYADTDENGTVDRNEFVYQANLHLDAIIRMNSDGYIIGNSASIRTDMIAYVKSMFGDFDGDGVVSWEDMVAQIANPGPVSTIAPKILQGDMNQDGVVDGEDVGLLFEAAGDFAPDEAFIFGLWAQIIVEASDAGYQLSLVEMVFGQNTMGGGGHRGPNDHNQTITSTWPPPPGFPVDWDWPADHLGILSSTWDWTLGVPSSDLPANHHSVISSTWGESSEDYWPPNHDVARSSTWNDDGYHQSMTSATWPSSHLRNLSIEGTETDDHVEIVSWQNADHDETTSENAGWPANHLLHLSRTWNTNHDRVTSSAWPSNHMMIISESWSPGRDWPANHYEVVSLAESQPGDHDWRLSLVTMPGNPFRLPPELFGLWASGSDYISLLDLN